jgi:magnesium-transporting ATPase (P-type)
LTDEEATQRLTAQGPNELEEARRTSPWRLFLSQFRELMVVVAGDREMVGKEVMDDRIGWQ